MKDNQDFEQAATIYFGQWLPIEDVVLTEHRNPESLLIEKDKIERLPRECEIVKDILLDLPEEVFFLNGKVSRMKFRKAVQAKTGWDKSRIEKVCLRLRSILLSY